MQSTPCIYLFDETLTLFVKPEQLQFEDMFSQLETVNGSGKNICKGSNTLPDVRNRLIILVEKRFSPLQTMYSLSSYI